MRAVETPTLGGSRQRWSTFPRRCFAHFRPTSPRQPGKSTETRRCHAMPRDGTPIPDARRRPVHPAEINAQSRGPFRRTLAKHLRAAEATPDAALQAFAEKHPDRLAQSAAIYGRLAGYTEKLEVDTHVAMQIAQLSDAELNAMAYASTVTYLQSLSAVERRALLAQVETSSLPAKHGR